MAQTVKNMPTMWETQVQSLGQESPLEKEMTTHSGILAWKFPWTEEPGTTVHGVPKSRTGLSDFTFTLSGRRKHTSVRFFLLLHINLKRGFF